MKAKAPPPFLHGFRLDRDAVPSFAEYPFSIPAIRSMDHVQLHPSVTFYQLLVYDEGGFFLSHRDSEKTGGMFGTLEVILPSAHEGGLLRIRHGDRQVELDLSGTEAGKIRQAAFHADCEHEVLPITRGHRVCLV